MGQLAAAFQISPAAVWFIVKGLNWKHLGLPVVFEGKKQQELLR